MAVRKSLILALAVSSSAGQAIAGEWSGPYVGISGGGSWGEQAQHDGLLVLPGGGGTTTVTVSTTTITTTTITTTVTTITSSTFTAPADGRYRLSGGLVGGAIGYNWQSDKFIYGLEGDGSWADLSGSGSCGIDGPTHSCGGSIRALGTVRGRIGYDLGPAFGPFGGLMVFAAGGLAVGELHAWDSLFGGSGSKTQAGWTVGGGVEAMLTPHWSIKLEYLHIDLGNPVVFEAIPTVPEQVRTRSDLVRVGVSYHFDSPVAPVIARY